MDTPTATEQPVEELITTAYIALQEAEEAAEKLTAAIAALRDHPEDPDGTYWAQEATAAATKALERVRAELPPDGIYKKGDDQ
jgi:hypothetical protein